MSTSVDALSASFPPHIGPFTIIQEIGAGGMGTVFLGRHDETQQLAAIKLLPPAMARDEGFRLRFSREIEAMQRVSSPHIVALYSSGEDLESVYYAMEYVAGETLSQRLRRERKLPWRDAVDICKQLCLALKAAHDAGVVHRDIKPSNILIDPQGMVKLTDFGIAQVFASDKLTMTGGVVGTAEYMSPEQAQGHRATRRSDLYSLGTVLYVMLTGRPPFIGQTSVEILQKHRYGQFDLPSRYVPEIPASLDDLIGELLEKNPDQRIPDAFVLSRRFDELIAREDRKTGHESATATIQGSWYRQGAASPPGEATFARDVVRAALSRKVQPRTLAKMTDNIWVLLALLVSLVLGLWWLSGRQPSDEDRFQLGTALMSHAPGPDWIRARDQYFLPLLERDEKLWAPRLESPLEEIEAYELEQQLLSSRRAGRVVKVSADIERQLMLIRQDWNIAHALEIRKKLEALKDVWSGDPHSAIALRIVEKWEDELDALTTDLPDPAPWLKQKLDQVVAKEGKNSPAARRISQSIVELYQDDPRASEVVKTAQEILESTPVE